MPYSKTLIFISTILLALLLAQTTVQTGFGLIIPPNYGEWEACQFLGSLYNSSLHVVAETPGSRTYYVASDNLLTGPIMKGGVCPNVSDSYGQQIFTAVDQNLCCNHGLDGMHETLLGHKISLPIHDSKLYNVTNDWSDPAGNYTVYYENHNTTAVLEDSRYADVAAYTALELEMTNHTSALQEISLLNSMYNWTAIGMQDDAFTNGTEKGVYQTFKLALYVLALEKTGQHVPPELEPRIMMLQGADGGFYTGYDASGAHQGMENVETTCIVILAMRAIPGKPPA